MNQWWDFYGPFGFTRVLLENLGSETEEDELDFEVLMDENVVSTGPTDEIIGSIATMKKKIGFDATVEASGLTAEEYNQQLVTFANEVTMYLEEKSSIRRAIPSDDQFWQNGAFSTARRPR